MSDSELILLQEESSPEVSPGMAETAGSLDGGNQPTEVELLARAKDRVDDNDRSLRSAAEALALAKELYGTSQAEMAYAVGKSPGWVSQLLSWHRSGFKGESPFGPKTKAGRLQHAKELAASGKARPRKAGRNVASVESENAPIDSESRKPVVDDGTVAAIQVARGAAETNSPTLLEEVCALHEKLSWDDKCKAFGHLRKLMGERSPSKSSAMVAAKPREPGSALQGPSATAPNCWPAAPVRHDGRIR